MESVEDVVCEECQARHQSYIRGTYVNDCFPVCFVLTLYLTVGRGDEAISGDELSSVLN